MFRRILQVFTVVIAIGVLSTVINVPHATTVVAQGEATPVPLVFPSPEPLQTRVENVATAIPTFTPTEQGPPVLRAREGAGDINLRSEADPGADIVGVLRVGEEFEVTGTYFLWYRLRYPNVRTNEAYVFGELVEIVGDASTIPDLTQVTAEPTIDLDVLGPTETFESIQQTPGFDLTLTASVREIAAPGNDPNAPVGSNENRAVLPTFTFPPDVVAQAPTAAGTGGSEMVEMRDEPSTVDVSEGVAPIVPIAALAALGVLGLLISVLRR